MLGHIGGVWPEFLLPGCCSRFFRLGSSRRGIVLSTSYCKLLVRYRVAFVDGYTYTELTTCSLHHLAV